jgi:hypothetical protein
MDDSQFAPLAIFALIVTIWMALDMLSDEDGS